MKTILFNPQQIESCWESEDVCFVKTKTGKVWVCPKVYPLPNEYAGIITTKEFLRITKENLVELVILQKDKGEQYGNKQ